MELSNIEREIFVDASPEVVFEVGSNPAHVSLEVTAPHTFSFRWTQPEGVKAAEGNSLFVTFELTPVDGGTNVKMIETGFREMGWGEIEMRATYDDHVQGWGYFIPRLGEYVATLEVRR